MSADGDALTAAGWFPGRDVRDAAMSAALETAAVAVPVAGGSPWTLFPAAMRALREFYGLNLRPAGAGRDVAASGCCLEPCEARHAFRAFEALGETVGLRLFPLGRTDSHGLLGVDESGRLFCLDHGGRWLLDDTVREGLCALTEGYAPHRIAPRRWAWAAPHAYEEPLGNAVRTALVAVYVLHHRKVFSARELRLTITTLRGIGQETLDRLVALPRGSLQDSAVPLVARMRALMAAEGAIPQGAELKITVAAPEGTRSPGASVSCAVRVGHSATEPAEAELSLSAGAGAVVGRPWAAVRGCAEDLARYGRARGRSDQVPVFPASTGPPF
ncbi:SUKH-3 domain-containing protein [Streptomyces sp. NPDC059892]|uniref:SUKH-3 domain-containing protein n=1 Tax=Streptomyces sp. NPDC059892 TaxID=3346989 RepID=UPI003663ECFC